MGTLKQNGDQKSHFGPHGNQSPQMGTNVGAVQTLQIVENFLHLTDRFGGGGVQPKQSA